jgi:hypothetical protein
VQSTPRLNILFLRNTLKDLTSFATQHWVIGGIAASLLWFLAGGQSLSNRRPDAAIAWQSVAVLMILAVYIRSAVDTEWLGLVIAVGVLCFEVRSIRRILAVQGTEGDRN